MIDGTEIVPSVDFSAPVPRETNTVALMSGCGVDGIGLIQPVRDVVGYLASRKPQPDWKDESALIARLTPEGRSEVKALVAACKLVRSLTSGRNAMSVQAACGVALRAFADRIWHPKTFRANYDQWARTQDWVCLVNLAKAPDCWREKRTALPEAFLEFCERRMASYNRDDARKEALRSIERQWRSGRNHKGDEQVIPGYEKGWNARNRELIPVGWSYSNIMRQSKTRGKMTRAVRALLNEGVSAARAHLPQVHSSRAKLRFLERVQFDDVKTDFRVFDPLTGEVMDLWLLIAHDVGTGVFLGFGMRPARAREDGSQEHLTLRDMKLLCGWLLERFGLPPYPMHWYFECGTATITEGTAQALRELLGDRIVVHFTGMISGKSPAGYREKGKGNSRGKASLESGNRLGHIISSHERGQTGPHYGVRPADLVAREKEAKAIWRAAHYLPVHLRSEVEYPMVTLPQARAAIVAMARTRNSRRDHKLEGFEQVLVWYNPATGLWQPQTSAPNPLPEGAVVEKRMESPDERAYRLAAPFRDQWSGVSPEVLVVFYEVKAEPVFVNNAGEIAFDFEERVIRFRAPADSLKLVPGTKALAYFHRDDPRFLHLTDGKGSILGTWLRVQLVDDEQSLSEAIAYSAAALRQAKDYAAHLRTDEREQLAAMRERNADLLQDFAETAVVDQVRTGEFTSPIARNLNAVSAAVKRRQKDAAAEAERAADQIFTSHQEETESIEDTSAADQLREAFRRKDNEP